jgi:hypothetical protein
VPPGPPLTLVFLITTLIHYGLSNTIIVPYGLDGMKKSWMVRFILKLINISHSISKIIFFCNQVMYNTLGGPSQRRGFGLGFVNYKKGALDS